MNRLFQKKLVRHASLVVIFSTLFIHGSKAEANQYLTSPSEVYMDGEKVYYPVKPIVKDGTTLVPLRETFEAMDAIVSWVPDERAVYATKGERHIKLTINSNEAFINSVPNNLLLAPIIYQDKTMIPLRFVGEAFNGVVEYTDDNNINITMPQRREVDFLPKDYDNVSNIINIENVELFGKRRLMVSDNPETLNSNTIQQDNVTLWNDVVNEDSTSEDHRVIGWHLNKFSQEVTVGITIENISSTNTIEVRNFQGIHKISASGRYVNDVGLPISEAVLNNRLLRRNLGYHRLGLRQSIQLESFKLQPDEIVGFLKDFTVVKTSGTGELNYIVRTVISKDHSSLTNIKSDPVPPDSVNDHPRGVWSGSELVATLPTYNLSQPHEISYRLSNGLTDDLLNADTSLVKNASSISNKGHYGAVYRVKIPYINESKEEKTVRVRIASRGGHYTGTVKTDEGVFNIPTLWPVIDVANVIDYKTSDHEGQIEIEIMHAGGSYLPIVVNVMTLK